MRVLNVNILNTIQGRYLLDKGQEYKNKITTIYSPHKNPYLFLQLSLKGEF